MTCLEQACANVVKSVCVDKFKKIIRMTFLFSLKRNRKVIVMAGTKEWIRFKYFDSIVFFVVLPVFVYIFYPVASHHIFL